MCVEELQKARTNVKKQSTRSASFKAWDKYKTDKWDPLAAAGQKNVGEMSSDMWKSADMAAEGTMDWYEKNTMSLRPSSTDDDTEVSDTTSANYSKSTSSQSSKTDKKGKTESKGGTGGSKRQFYAN